MKTAGVNYQIVVEYPASLAQKEQKENLAQVEKQLGSDIKVSFADWGEKELAYAIEGQLKAKFWIGKLTVEEGTSVDWKNLKTYLNRDKKIMRYLILKI